MIDEVLVIIRKLVSIETFEIVAIQGKQPDDRQPDQRNEECDFHVFYPRKDKEQGGVNLALCLVWNKPVTSPAS